MRILAGSVTSLVTYERHSTQITKWWLTEKKRFRLESIECKLVHKESQKAENVPNDQRENGSNAEETERSWVWRVMNRLWEFCTNGSVGRQHVDWVSVVRYWLSHEIAFMPSRCNDQNIYASRWTISAPCRNKFNITSSSTPLYHKTEVTIGSVSIIRGFNNSNLSLG